MTQALGRSARKRQTILSAGRDLFLSNGYQGTSVDQIAASAEVSKQTVYKHFGDKHELLLAIVNHALESTVTPFLKRIRALADTADLEADLTALAADYLRAVLFLIAGPMVVLLYYDQAPARTLAAFAECFSVLHDRGLLRVPEPADAAEHFAFLVVGRCIDQALFCGGPDVLASVDVGSHVRAGVRVFLAAYQIHTR